jgi:hypothetical protein
MVDTGYFPAAMGFQKGLPYLAPNRLNGLPGSKKLDTSDVENYSRSNHLARHFGKGIRLWSLCSPHSPNADRI